jgi:ElaB/YqjD/DUF883 family membrane-anchored ribosome-binding protein
MMKGTAETAESRRIAAEQARAKASDAYAAAREKAASAYDSAREGARAAGHRTASSIEDNPLAALIGAAAVGLLAGALLPATRREADALGPLGGKITDSAKSAVSAGREALDSLGINEAAARTQISKLFAAVAKSVSSAAAPPGRKEDEPR